jgi:predicted CoA-binding protein
MTLVLGASLNPERYSNLALKMLADRNLAAIGVGPKAGEAYGIPIVSDLGVLKDLEIDTVTLYLRSELQEAYYPSILALKPSRVIFNPGTENPEFANRLQRDGIEVVDACTLVLLTTGVY